MTNLITPILNRKTNDPKSVQIPFWRLWILRVFIVGMGEGFFQLSKDLCNASFAPHGSKYIQRTSKNIRQFRIIPNNLPSHPPLFIPFYIHFFVGINPIQYPNTHDIWITTTDIHLFLTVPVVGLPTFRWTLSLAHLEVSAASASPVLRRIRWRFLRPGARRSCRAAIIIRRSWPHGSNRLTDGFGGDWNMAGLCLSIYWE